MASRIVAARWRLPRPIDRRVDVVRGLRIPAPGGVTLAADRYHPRDDPSAPLILIRCPYGRRAVGTGLTAHLLAERGYQVLLQSTRGTFDSDGAFEPFTNEAADGVATVAWLREQPWFNGTLATWGASYETYAQWALMSGDVPELRAAVMQLGSSDLGEAFVYPNGVFALADTMSWARIVRNQESLLRLIRSSLGSTRALRRAHDRLPLGRADRDAVGGTVDFVQEWLRHEDRDDEYWASIRHRDRALRGEGSSSVAAHLVAGWYDIYLPAMVQDYAAIRRSGRQARLVIGPWHHMSMDMYKVAVSEGLAWLDAHLKGRGGRLPEHPVRVFVTGVDEWRDLECWPPPGVREASWYLRSGGVLAMEPPISGSTSMPDRYRYDPADPTPAVGGILAFDRKAGPQDNRGLEARSDVLTYTSAVLDSELHVMGPVSALLFTRSSRRHTDFFVRLCDVHPDGRSVNVCDGLVRLSADPPGNDGIRATTVDLWPTAHAFRRGHRLRVQVSSGSHPRWARNLGGGEPIVEARTAHVADQEIFQDAARPSVIRLPVAIAK